jgi:nucleotide-binding universal stress UspA family protein
MSGVVCAIKGGADSQPTVAEAVQIAQAQGLSLYLLHVISLDFLERTVSSRTRLVSKELFTMGEFILASAKEEAEAQGMVAKGVVRKGKVVEEIIRYCLELPATYLVLGEPRKRTDEDLFTEEQFRAFMDQVEKETGTKVIVSAGENG